MTHPVSHKGARREKTPQRTCIVSRRTAPREELLRFVLGPDGQVVFDVKGNLPGRGAWVSPEAGALREAVRRNAFSRAFRAAARVPPGFEEQVRKALSEAALSTLSLARKAGQAVAGFEKVSSWIAGGRVRVLVEAADAAADGRRKLAGRLKSAGSEAEIVDSFDSGQLGLAFGRPNVIHAAMTHGALAERFLSLVRKAAGLAGSEEGQTAAGEMREQSRQ